MRSWYGRPTRHKLVTGSLLSGDVVQATPTPQHRTPSSVSGALPGVGVDLHQDVDAAIARALNVDAALREVTQIVPCPVIQIGYGREIRARRRGRRPMGGAA